MGANDNQALGKQRQEDCGQKANPRYPASSWPVWITRKVLVLNKQTPKQSSLNDENKITSTDCLCIINVKICESRKFGINFFEI